MEIIEGHKDVEIEYCKNCKKIYYREKIIPLSEFKKAFTKYIKNHIKFNVKPDKFYVDDLVIDNLNKLPKSMEIAVRAEAGQKEEEGFIPIVFKPTECPVCSRLKGGYYEGILQLRNKENEGFEDCIKEIERNTQAKELVAVTNKINVKGGVDFYISDKKYIRSLANTLHQKYGGELKLSPHLHTSDRQSSKQVYRINALLRLPGFNIDDIIKYKGEYYKIVSFKSDKINAKSITSEKNKPIKMDEASKVAEKKDFKEVIVTKKKPKVEILHPETFESTPIENKKEVMEKKIPIIIINEKIYAV